MKKNTFFSSLFFTFFTKVADLTILNIVFLLCCLPIVTIGPALTAMFYVTLRMVRKEDGYIVKDFFHSFRQNLKQGIVIHLIFLLITTTLVFDVYVMWNLMEVNWTFKFLTVLFLIIAVLLFMTFMYLYPTLAQFDNTTKRTIRNAMFFSVRHFPYTLSMMLITVFPLFCAWLIKYFIEWGILAFAIIGFSLIAYINSHFFVRIFDKYIEEQENVVSE